MNYKQNEKILQLTDNSLIIGVDIAKNKHVARAQETQLIIFPIYFIDKNNLLCEK
ncbi:hypothetical protein J32TS6_12530 [Virgibacillus pantothenticus]|uniref:hypothetical protein n=1 Tax=Virgibacillus pantothenticus TaxID=1473 RepID=UPI001B054B52|nr:hypothetical protein [Virgibacillus pantothenticus]GIP62698.1 hypothetical protein J32TS6_12530 [Virgibacillus pantothenticus]